mgnify:FL=1
MSHSLGEWTGLRGKFHAWFFSTYTRKIMELLIFGNYWSSFKKESARRIRHGNEMVLDIGSGSGNFSLPIARKMKQGKVCCLDLSLEMTDFLQMKARHKSLQNAIRILNCDASETGLDDSSIDWVVSGNCMHEMPHPEKILAEVYRVLKPRGAVFIVDFMDWHGFHAGEAHGPYSVQQLSELFSEAGFKNVSVEKKRHFVVGIAEKV